MARIEEITAEAEIGRIYQGKVVSIVDFGAFVNILPGKDGLLHISQIAEERVEKVGDYLEGGTGGRSRLPGHRSARTHQAVDEGSPELRRR